jgi:hypothetical protein
MLHGYVVDRFVCWIPTIDSGLSWRVIAGHLIMNAYRYIGLWIRSLAKWFRCYWFSYWIPGGREPAAQALYCSLELDTLMLKEIQRRFVIWIKTPDNTLLRDGDNVSHSIQKQWKTICITCLMLKKLNDVITLTSKNYCTITLCFVLCTVTELFTGKMFVYSLSPICAHCYGIVWYNLPLTSG